MFRQARYRSPFCVRAWLMAVVIVPLLFNTTPAAGQEADPFERKVSITVKDVPLRAALEGIAQAAGVKFGYSTTRLDMNKSVSVEADNAKLRDVLNTLLAPLRIVFKLDADNKTIFLSPVMQQTSKVKDDTSYTPSGTVLRVTGTVTDATTNEPMPGVSVLVKGTANGIATDVEGNYTIEVADNGVLIFSFIGYKNREETIAARSSVNVTMESDEKTLSTLVVNAGYYNVLDKEKTGSISRVSSEVIERQPVVNPLQAMQGRMPGVQITQYTGMPNGGFQVRIRGTNSLANGLEPLYIIDGVPFAPDKITNQGMQLYGRRWEQGVEQINGQSALTSINPNDIESIEVLKDADATAIYGSRGSNGVVLITTKRGKPGKVKLRLDAKSGVSMVTNRVEMLNTEQYLAIRNQAIINDGASAPRVDEYDINGTWDQTRYTNWQDVLLGGTAQMTDINASISGGSKETQFTFGVGYNKQGVVFPGNKNAKRFSTNFSVSHKTADEKFRARFGTNYSINDSNLLAFDLAPIALRLVPNAPNLYDVNGELNWENSTWINPLAYLQQSYTSITYNLLTNAELSYTLAKNLVIKSTFGLNDVRVDDQQIDPSTAYRPIEKRTPANSSLSTSNGAMRSWIIEPQVSYEVAIGRGRLNVLVGGTYQNLETTTDRKSYMGFPSNVLITNPNAASNTTSSFVGYALYKYAATYGRFNYAWNDKYFINLTGRRDGSSRFGPGNKFATLGAIGAAWIFSNESFVKTHLPVLSFGKLRASYGHTGNDQIGNYQYVNTYATVSQYQNVATLQPRRLFNPDYSWEVNKKMEAAFELGFFNDNVLLTTAWYRNRTSNQLINYQLPGTTGFTSVLMNFPAVVQNTGLEVEINTTNVSRGEFSWTSSFNITFPRNKLVSFEGLESSSYANQYAIGKPLTIKKLYRFEGINPETGLYDVDDVNNDGQFTPADRVMTMNYAPFYYGGLNNSISFKGIQLDIFFEYAYLQRDAPMGAYFGGYFDSFYGLGNVPVTALQGTRWTEHGDEAQKQRYTRLSRPNVYESDLIIDNIHRIRLKNVALSYQLPANWIRTIQCRLYTQLQNLFTITDYKGLDPETGESMPLLMTFVAGVQLSF